MATAQELLLDPVFQTNVEAINMQRWVTAWQQNESRNLAPYFATATTWDNLFTQASVPNADLVNRVVMRDGYWFVDGINTLIWMGPPVVNGNGGSERVDPPCTKWFDYAIAVQMVALRTFLT